MSLNVTMKRQDGDFKFTWEGESDDFEALWDHCDILADQCRSNAFRVAAEAITHFYKKGVPDTEEERNGFEVWISCAVLHAMKREPALQAAMDKIGATYSIFEIAAYQTIDVEIESTSPGKFSIGLHGRPTPLDS
jgi:hypothetical protein